MIKPENDGKAEICRTWPTFALTFPELFFLKFSGMFRKATIKPENDRKVEICRTWPTFAYWTVLICDHRRLCRVKNMLAIYLKYHKAELTPTTPVTSIAISSVKLSIGRKSLTNLHSEMIFLSIICIPRSTEVFIHFVSHILASCNVSSV
jgi:hypothetical protein